MTKLQKTMIRQSETREAINRLLDVDERTPEQDTELHELTGTAQRLEVEYRGALVAQGEEVETHATTETLDSEGRERLRLRSRASIGEFIAARLEGREPAGALAEYGAACKTPTGEIPIDIFEADRPATEDHADAVTAAPSTVGVNIGPIHPAVFAASIGPRLGIANPTVSSGTYAELRITTSATAGARTKGEGRESSAIVLGAVSTKPRSISARISFRAEDRLEIGTSAFEPSIRSNMTMALSSEYDDQCINGSGTAPAVQGLYAQLPRPAANPTTIANFDSLLSTVAAEIDGLWARRLSDVLTVVPPDVYKLSTTAFRDVGTNNGHRGDISAQAYLQRETGGWWTASRMPNAPASGDNANVASAICYRRGQSLTTAVHPVWSSISISDPFTDSGSATHHITAHLFVGAQVLIVQPSAYDHVLIKVA